MKAIRKPAVTAACLLAAIALGACASSRTIVLTNTSDESWEMRREGAKTATTVDPGGSTTLEVPVGQPVDLNGVVIQVY